MAEPRPTQGISSWAALLALAVLQLLASWPALGGGWIYDDRKLLSHPKMDGWDDVAAVFSRNSEAYLAHGEPPAQAPAASYQGGVTYRPLSMASLIGVHVASGGSPLAHRLLSLVLHLLAFSLLLLGWSGGWRRRVPWSAALLWGGLALHPALCEAYDWINGRADVLAGVALAGLALLLTRAGGAAGASRWRRGGVVALRAFPLLLLGMLAKETFLPAAGALVLALAGPGAPVEKPAEARPGSPGGALVAAAALVPLLVALGLAFAAFWLLRLCTGAGSGGVATGRVLLPVELLADLARLPGLAVESLLLPLPRAMRLLSWDVAQPWSVSQLVGTALVLAITVWLTARRRWRALVLLVGAVATLAPTVLVVQYCWLGFDRYLYLPVLLLTVALLPHRQVLTAPAPVGRAAWVVGLLFVAVMTASNFATARVYRNQLSFAEGVLELRPEEPTGYLLAAAALGEAGLRAEAKDTLRRIPERDLPPALAHAVAKAQLQFGLQAAATATVERAAARAPAHPLVRYDLLSLRGGQGRLEEALPLAEELLRAPVTCVVVRALLLDWQSSGALSAGVLARVRELLTAYPCLERGGSHLTP